MTLTVDTTTIDTVTIDGDRASKARHRAVWASGDYPAVAAEVVAPLGPTVVEAGASITWTTMNDHQARAVFTRGDHTVSAELTFDDQDQLTDFTSDDKFAVPANSKTPRRQRWSTPLRRYRSFHGRTISSTGLGVRHAPAPEGDFAYLEFELDDILYS